MPHTFPSPLSPPGLSTSVLICFLCLGSGSFSATEPSFAEKQRHKAIQFEKRGAWLEACRCWEELVRRDRQDPLAREGLHRCQRRLQLWLRHTDTIYHEKLKHLSPSQALDVYEQILTILHVAHPDRDRTHYTPLFRQGLEELRLALDEPNFRKQYLSGVKPAAIEAFKQRLTHWVNRLISTRSEARELALEVIRAAAQDGIPLRQKTISAMVLEFAAGASNTLDEHSAFLAPGNFALIQAALRGKVVGVGVEVGFDDHDGVQITRIHAKGPAEEAGLEVGDRILRVGRTSTEHLPPDYVAELLRGEPNSSVELEIERDIWDGSRTVCLQRRVVNVTSVELSRLEPLDDGSSLGVPVGYIKIHHFQDSTPHEVKEAILTLSTSPEIKGLILDLRGNPGGVFKAAVAVAELFVNGVIVVGQSPFKEFNRPFKSETGGPIDLPMVVLVDQETASAAEVLAGALQGGRPFTKLIGQTTYGKGSIQCIIPVEKGLLDGSAGVRLTVAKLFSPSNQPYTGRGVVPDLIRGEKGDLLILEARKVLLELLRPTLTKWRLPMRDAKTRVS